MSERTPREVPRRRRADTRAELRDQAVRLAGIVDSAMDAIVAVDGEQRISAFNRAAELMFRCPAAEAIGRPIDRFIPERFRGAHAEHIREFWRTGVTARSMSSPGELVGLRADGEEFPIEATISQFETGGQKLFTVILRDITERKRSEAERAEILGRERRARAEAEAAHRRALLLAEASRHLAGSLDAEASLAAVARLVATVFADYCFVHLLEPAGSSVRRVAVACADPAKADLVRRLEDEPPPDPGEPHPVVRALLAGRGQLLPEVPDALLQALAQTPDHLELLRRLGARSAVSVPLVARGRTLGVVTLVTAGSGRRYGPDDLALAEELAQRAALAVDNARLYHEAQAAAQEAREAVRARETFLARASHELRTPLTSALGTVRLLGRAMAGTFRQSPQELVEIASRNLDMMLALINDLLDASKLAAGTEPLTLAPVELSEVVGRSLEVVGAQAREKGVAVRAAVPAGLTVPGDQRKLEQVLVNLLANAVKFTPSTGNVVVEAEPGRAGITLRVHDTGAGIAQEDLEIIFQPFFQVRQPGRPAARGTGLGLTICRQIMTLHGGRIWAESPGRGRGSTFVVTFPRPRAGQQVA